MSIGTNAKGIAPTIIALFGEPVTITRTGGTFDRDTSTYVDGDDTTQSATMAFDTKSSRFKSGKTDKEGLTTAYVAAQGLDFVPAEGDKATTAAGAVWEVVAVDTIGANGVAACYRLDLRGLKA